MNTGKHEHACWNEKFSFELPTSDWNNITHIKFRIMETKLLNNESVGATVYELKNLHILLNSFVDSLYDVLQIPT